MKPEKLLDQLSHYYWLQHCIARSMGDAHTAHARGLYNSVLYSLFEYELCKDELEAFWGKFSPHYCDAIALRNG